MAGCPQPRRRRAAIAAVLALAVLAGCQRGDPVGPVTPLVHPSSQSGSGSVTPSVTPTPTKEALLAEAERRYREFFALQNQLEGQGGSATLSPEFASYMASPYLEAAQKYYGDMKKGGGHVEDAKAVVIVDIEPIDPSTQPGAEVAIRTCADGTKSWLVYSDGTREPGVSVQNDYWFKRDGAGVLRIFEASGVEVEKC